jgi:hypothetical protein
MAQTKRLTTNRSHQILDEPFPRKVPPRRWEVPTAFSLNCQGLQPSTTQGVDWCTELAADVVRLYGEEYDVFRFIRIEIYGYPGPS